MLGFIHQIESMGLVDGPGVRTVVFLQGCSLRCKYCHNPETWAKDGGKFTLSPSQLVEKLLKYKDYFGADGGVTISGGEPLLQMEFVTQTFKLLKQHNVHTCLDTAGVFSQTENNVSQKLDELFKFTDLVLLDIKHFDDEKYKYLTGQSIDTFNFFLNRLQSASVPIIVRHVIVPTLTDGVQHVLELRQYLSKLKNLTKIELLPYHTLGLEKYKNLNLPYSLKNVTPPTKLQMDEYQKIINQKEI